MAKSTTFTMAVHELLPGVDDETTRAWLNFIKDTKVYVRLIPVHNCLKRVYVFQIGTDWVGIPKKFVADPFIRTVKGNDKNMLRKILQDLLRWKDET